MIVDLRNGVSPPEVMKLASGLRGPAFQGPLRADPADLSAPTRAAAAAARVPGFLPEDHYDRQPLRSQDGSMLFVCQARLDNREELFAKLGMREPLDQVADSTILFESYQRWGEGANAYLLGDYAFAAYSFESRTVFASVDHVAHYRLYFAARGARMVLCSQLAALKNYENGAELDVVALGLSTEARYEPGRTPFQGIRQLDGGTCLRWSGGAAEIRRWWQPSSVAHYRRPPDYIESVREQFQRAVSKCLRAASPVCSMLSGGLDSGLVTAAAARILHDQGKSLKALTSAPALGVPVFERSGWDADDSSFAAATAAMHPNIEHVILRSDGRSALDLMPQIHARCATAVRNGANHLWMDAMGQRVGAGVILTGARGNFSVSYSGLGANLELLRARRFAIAFRSASEMRQAEGRPVWRTLAAGVLPRTLVHLVRGTREELGIISLTASAFREQHDAALHPARPAMGTRSALVRSMTLGNYVWAADPLPMWGVEWRDPTGDRRVLELLLSFPLVAYLHKGRTRGIARELGHGFLPEPVRLRKSRGSQAADYASAMARALTAYRQVHRRMSASRLCREIFDLGAIERALERVAEGSVSPEFTAPIDRVIDAGLFLMDEGVDR